jgi:queuine/archaeosine tRNA-ribosyltransferase
VTGINPGRPRPLHAAGTLAGFLVEVAAGIDPCDCCKAALAAEIRWCRDQGIDPDQVFPRSKYPREL